MKPAFAMNPTAWIHRAAPSTQWQDTQPQEQWQPVVPGPYPQSSSASLDTAATYAPERPSWQPSRLKLVMTISAALLAVLGLGLTVGAYVAKAVSGMG